MGADVEVLVPGFVWWVAGIGLSLAMCLRRCVMRWDG
jgi:hypothetical protein